MDEAGIRALLRARVEWGISPGRQVVMHEAVTAAGADAEAVERYLVAGGGEHVEPEGHEHVPAERRTTRSYWLVPGELLAA